MPNGVKKENLPQKMCVTCNRPFTWRKKWERCWDEVSTCSKRCNAERRSCKASKQNDSLGDVLEDLSRQVLTVDMLDEAVKIEEVEGAAVNCASEDDSQEPLDDDPKAAKKAARKVAKAARRAKREGYADKSVGQKQCDACDKSVDLLIRCQIDETKAWKMVCGKCWRVVSGGQVDGDADHPHYRYGGLWKNRGASTV